MSDVKIRRKAAVQSYNQKERGVELEYIKSLRLNSISDVCPLLNFEGIYYATGTIPDLELVIEGRCDACRESEYCSPNTV